jgi:hypothetical protein
MRVRRFTGTLLATALVAAPVAVVATAAPAAAATPTKVVMKVSNVKTRFGDPIAIQGQVKGQTTDGGYQQLPSGSGTATLQFRKHGSSSWQTVQTDSDGNAFYFYPVKVTGPGSMRVLYSGGTSGGAEFNPSDVTQALKVQRRISYKENTGRQLGIHGKIAPQGKVKISVLRKEGRKFRGFKTLHSNGKGLYKVVLPAPRRGTWHWKIIFQGSKGYVDSVITGRTYRG